MISLSNELSLATQNKPTSSWGSWSVRGVNLQAPKESHRETSFKNSSLLQCILPGFTLGHSSGGLRITSGSSYADRTIPERKSSARNDGGFSHFTRSETTAFEEPETTVWLRPKPEVSHWWLDKRSSSAFGLKCEAYGSKQLCKSCKQTSRSCNLSLHLGSSCKLVIIDWNFSAERPKSSAVKRLIWRKWSKQVSKCSKIPCWAVLINPPLIASGGGLQGKPRVSQFRQITTISSSCCLTRWYCCRRRRRGDNRDASVHLLGRGTGHKELCEPLSMVQVVSSELNRANEVKADGVAQNSWTNMEAKLMGLNNRLESLRLGKDSCDTGDGLLALSGKSVDFELALMPLPPHHSAVDAHCSADAPVTGIRWSHPCRRLCLCLCPLSLEASALGDLLLPLHRCLSLVVFP